MHDLVLDQIDAFRKILIDLKLVFIEENNCFKIWAYRGLEKINDKTSVER